MVRDEAIKKVCAIDGWLSRSEAELLYNLAHNADGPIVEIGSYLGRSTSALALGSLSGRKQVIYAIDPFIGTGGGNRQTSLNNDPSTLAPTPAMLRSNLDSVGVNGTVRIISKRSEEAIGDVPASISLLFVDGQHDYESVCKDLENYLPRIKRGGFVVLHDVTNADMGVVRAVEDKLVSRPNQWRSIDRVGSACIFRRVDTERCTINLMCPGRGYDWAPMMSVVQPTFGAHKVVLDNNANGWDDFNALWARALNRFENGECTHTAMVHSDIAAPGGWIDVLKDELDEHGLDMISVGCSMKDNRALWNCGVGNLANRWAPWRRIAVKEALKLPPTFGFDDLVKSGFCGSDPSDKVFLHNTGCWIADLRKPIFRQTDANGDLVAWFDFPTRIRRDENGQWANLRESEDWFWSHKLHELGAKTKITRKIRIDHEGKGSYPNIEPYGLYDVDEDCRHIWEPGYQRPKKTDS